MSSICISGSVAKPFGPSANVAAPVAPHAVTRAIVGIDFGAVASKALANLFISFLAAIVIVATAILS